METKSRYKLRSSLKKTKSKSVDQDEENLESTILPPPRRVSFAASNYVKPFIDDPEKNTIWDNTYEEQVESTADSAKSELCYNQSQSNIAESLMQSKVINKTIIFNENEMDMEYTLQDNVIGGIKETVNTINTVYEQTLSDMEMTCVNQTIDKKVTCQFKNKVSGSNSTELNYIMNKTNLNESRMEMTCNYNLSPNIITSIPVLDRTKIQNESMEFTCQYNLQKSIITQPVDPENKENYTVHSTSVFQLPHTIVDKENKVVDIQAFGNSTVTMDHTINTTEMVQKSKQHEKKTIVGDTLTTTNWSKANSTKVATCDGNGTITNIKQSQIAPVKQIHRESKKTCTFNGIPIASDVTDQSIDIQTNKSGILDGTFQKVSGFNDITSHTFVKDQNINAQRDINEIPFTKPHRLEVFGGIPIAVDVTDQSLNVQSNLNETQCKEPLKMAGFGSIPVTAEVSNHSINIQNIIQSSKHNSMNETQSRELQKKPVFEDIPSRADVSNQRSNVENTNANQSRKCSKVEIIGGIPIAVDESNQSLNTQSNIEIQSKESQKTVVFGDISENQQKHNPRIARFQQNETQKNQDQQATNTNTGNSMVFGGIPIAVDLTNQSANVSQKPLDLKYCNDQNLSLENIPDSVRYNTSSMAVDFSSHSLRLAVDKVENSDIIIADPSVDINKMSIYKEECSLVDSLPSLDEIELQHLSSTYFNSKNEVGEPSVREDSSFIKELPTQENCEKIISYTKHPTNKVIYSEPMMVTKIPVTDSVSIHTSGLNFFNFNSILSMEDTQQLIQATFSKPSFQCIENEKNDSATVSHFDLTTNVTQPVINSAMSETLKAQSFLNKIEHILVKDDFAPVNFDFIISKIKESQEMRMNIETLLQEFPLLDIKRFDLEDRCRRKSLGVTTSNLAGLNRSYSSVHQGSDSTGSTYEDNCHESSVVGKSLNDNIAEICERSNNVVKFNDYQNNCYILEVAYELVIILVRLHPEDNHVVDIKSDSCVKESAMLVRFITNDITHKLNPNHLKSYLGSHFDILSLLDYICVIVEENKKFYEEFLTLQETHSTLTIQENFSISFEILCTKPPIWWTVNLKMLPLYRIQPESVTVQSRFGKVNEEHIRQLARNTEDNVYSLKIFIEKVIEYFKRTQIMFKNVNMK